MTPDSALVTALLPSPNHDERRRGKGPDCIVLHYTGMADGASARARLVDPAAQVSSHYLVEEDGQVVQMVAEARRAWHAGRSAWMGETDLNSVSVGIEIVNGGHDFGLPPFAARQIEAVAALCRDVMGRNAIPPERVLAHSDVAPGRKQDPGERFPWATLAEAGAGLWVAPSNDTFDAVPPGTAGEAVRRLQVHLARLGYGLEATGRYDDATTTVVRAFQRRFRPAHVDGRADAGTRLTLDRLLELRFGGSPTISADREGTRARA